MCSNGGAFSAIRFVSKDDFNEVFNTKFASRFSHHHLEEMLKQIEKQKMRVAMMVKLASMMVKMMKTWFLLTKLCLCRDSWAQISILTVISI